MITGLPCVLIALPAITDTHKHSKKQLVKQTSPLPGSTTPVQSQDLELAHVQQHACVPRVQQQLGYALAQMQQGPWHCS